MRSVLALAVCVLVCSVTALAQGPVAGGSNGVLMLPATVPGAKSSPRERAVFEDISAQSRLDVTRSPFAVVRQDAKVYGVLDVEFDTPNSCQRFQVPGVHLLSRFDRFADVFIRSQTDWDAVERAPGVIWCELANVLAAPPPIIGQPARTAAGPEEIARGGVGDRKGRGVIIAVIDSGIDFHNPDFIQYDNEGKPISRLLYFWDTLSAPPLSGSPGSAAPINYPNGASIGAIFDRDVLTAELRSDSPKIPVWDTDGHGTACAGIAAGNGNNSKKRYQGVAPEADIIAVRIGRGPGLENSYLLGSVCDWLHNVAGDRPLVVSCSFGGQYGGRDGYRVEERRLDALFASDRKGRALCIAAGNEGLEWIHSDVAFGDKTHACILKWSSLYGGTIDLYLKADDVSKVRLVNAGQELVLKGGCMNMLTKNYVATIAFPGGSAEMQVYSLDGKMIEGDAYLSGIDYTAQFDQNNAAVQKQIATPGGAANAITVGSYDFDNRFHHYGTLDAVGASNRTGQIIPLPMGYLSNYSNPGPGRLGNVVKPDVAAPGRYFVTSAAMNTSADRDTSGHYRLFSGTSAATPYVAGVVALIMEKRPTITVGEIKQLIHEHATEDANTGQVPNREWGHGKLDLKAIKEIVR